MATKKFASAIVSVFSMLLMFLLFSCTQEEITDSRSVASTKPSDPQVGLDIDYSIAHDTINSVSSVEDIITSKITFLVLEDGVATGDPFVFSKSEKMNAKIYAEKDKYQITEDLIESKAVATNIDRAYNTTNNQLYNEVDTVRIQMNDGQIVVLPVNISTEKIVYRDINYFMPSDTLISAKLISAVNSNITSRATYVTKTLNTVYTVELTFSEKNVKSAKTFKTTLKTSATRYVIAEDDIDKVEVTDKKREVINDLTEKVSFTENFIMKSGETSQVSKSLILNRLFKGIDPYEKIVTSFAYGNPATNGVQAGTSANVSSNEGWSVMGRTDSYGANISNGVSADKISTSYSLYHESATYKDSYVTVEFGYETVSVSEVSNNVETSTSNKTGYEMAVNTNNVRTAYIGYNQSLSELVYLYKIAKTVSGYSFENAKLTINDNNVVAELDYITKYNTGETETEHATMTFDRSLVCTSNWTSVEANASQVTGDASVNVSGSSNKTNGFWSYVSETRAIKTIASLASSTQTNSWNAIVPNKICYTRNGKTYEFGEIAFSTVNKGASVSISDDNDNMTSYSYKDIINVAFGNNTVSSTALGSFTVAKEWKSDFPEEWGKFVSATSTVAVDASGRDWTYTWSIHFANGTLPVIVAKNASSATIDQNLFAYDTNSKLNGAVYRNGWLNSIASDEANYMLWTNSEGKAQGSMVYPTATMWNWNNGKNSVFTNAFSFIIENDGKTLTVKKGDTVWATYKAAK